MGNKSSSKARKMNAVITGATKNYSSVLIFLHGLGDTGHGWASILKDVVPPSCKIICPNASAIPVTLNGGMRMPSWFDICSLSSDGIEDADGIRKAATKLEEIVASESSNGVPFNKIFVGGFSQGGAVALYHALTSDHSGYAGVVALSCWLPLHKTFVSDPSILKMPKTTPILQCHGTFDPVVNFKIGNLTSEHLKALSLPNHEFKAYQGLDHSSCPEEMTAVKDFLAKNTKSD